MVEFFRAAFGLVALALTVSRAPARLPDALAQYAPPLPPSSEPEESCSGFGMGFLFGLLFR